MSFFHSVEAKPIDPIFGLAAKFQTDTRKSKVDLTLGVFKNEDLQIVILDTVKEMERRLLEEESNKGYCQMFGNPSFIEQSAKLVFGEDLYLNLQGKLYGAQTVGGTGGLFLAGNFLQHANITKKIYCSTPTWANHKKIFSQAGLEFCNYPYLKKGTVELSFEEMLFAIDKMDPGSAILFHATCHNPTGIDPTYDQWKALANACAKRGLIPVFDFAYQGFGTGVEEDAYGIRCFAEKGMEVLVANSFSKNFSLYGERVGTLFVISHENYQGVKTHIESLIRGDYSNPPIHGASIVSGILQDRALKKKWLEELSSMRNRIHTMRDSLARLLKEKKSDPRWDAMSKHSGMFSMLGISPEQAEKLVTNHGVYVTKSGRVNITGLNEKNLPYVVDSIIKVL